MQIDACSMESNYGRPGGQQQYNNHYHHHIIRGSHRERRIEKMRCVEEVSKVHYTVINIILLFSEERRDINFLIMSS